ncbi:MAG: cytochrome c [Pirellula sp.]|nr:cytochrome c [Pirellula sp.]
MKSSTRHWILAGSLASLLGLVGCREPIQDANLHEPNYLFAHSMQISQDTEMDEPLLQAKTLLKDWFGTVDAPKIPEALREAPYTELFTEANLKLASGDSSVPGLYSSQQCASCHGLSGQGRGVVAASQNPYPRDFRPGWFKYKSTPRSAKPLKADIARVLRKGLSGTQMPIFDKLKDSEIDALVDYVVFLSIRGEFERALLQDAAMGNEEEKEDLLTAIADRWVEASDATEEFEPPPFPLVGSETPENAEQLAASIQKGKELFAGPVAACSQCHGEGGNGTGTKLPDYDDWTKEWTAKIGLNPDDLDEIAPLMARGGMKPQHLKPRSIVEGHLRGGREPIDIYRRIRYGIAGSPMPAASLAASSEDTGLQPDDLWHLVNYVLSIAQVPPPPISSTPTGDTVAVSP